MSLYPRTWAEIDLRALQHNVRLLKEKAAGALLSVVVKADAYGHGLVPAGRAAYAAGADWLAVATVSEGVALREAEIGAPILILSPFLPVEAEQAVYYDLRASVQDVEMARALDAAAHKLGKQARVHLKIDTGMRRFGAEPEDAASVAKEISSLSHTLLEGVWTHFAWSAGDPGFTQRQYSLFQETVRKIQESGISIPIRHCANSGALVQHPQMTLDLVRVGILAYGVSHIPDGPRLPIQRVLTWKTHVMALRTVPAGQTVGYNMTWRASRKTRLATLGVGYGDGYHRFLGNKGWVVIHGQRAPIRGLVCMDQIMVDVTDLPSVSVGDEVTLIGEGVSAEEVATLVGTTPHEITTRIMSRVPRKYLH
ncbi:MAG: alanine racemase [Armatimonadetes bacterium]|nr:MAG: alanine racemase [Armatimonadota bacterium]